MVRLQLTLETYVDLFGGDVGTLRDKAGGERKPLQLRTLVDMLANVMRNCHRFITVAGDIYYLRSPVNVVLRRPLTNVQHDHSRCQFCTMDGDLTGAFLLYGLLPTSKILLAVVRALI